MMKKYGITLLENMPKETTQFLKRLCTDYRPSNKPLVDQVRVLVVFHSTKIYSAQTFIFWFFVSEYA
jgi:hypothetical protein